MRKNYSEFHTMSFFMWFKLKMVTIKTLLFTYFLFIPFISYSQLATAIYQQRIRGAEDGADPNIRSAFSPNNYIWVVENDGELEIRLVANNWFLKSIDGVKDFEFSTDNRLFYMDSIIKCIDVNEIDKTTFFPGLNTHYSASIKLSQNNRWLAVTVDSNEPYLVVYDIEKQKIINKIPGINPNVPVIFEAKSNLMFFAIRSEVNEDYVPAIYSIVEHKIISKGIYAMTEAYASQNGELMISEARNCIFYHSKKGFSKLNYIDNSETIIDHDSLSSYTYFSNKHDIFIRIKYSSLDTRYLYTADKFDIDSIQTVSGDLKEIINGFPLSYNTYCSEFTESPENIYFTLKDDFKGGYFLCNVNCVDNKINLIQESNDNFRSGFNEINVVYNAYNKKLYTMGLSHVYIYDPKTCIKLDSLIARVYPDIQSNLFEQKQEITINLNRVFSPCFNEIKEIPSVSFDASFIHEEVSKPKIYIPERNLHALIRADKNKRYFELWNSKDSTKIFVKLLPYQGKENYFEWLDYKANIIGVFCQEGDGTFYVELIDMNNPSNVMASLRTSIYLYYGQKDSWRINNNLLYLHGSGSGILLINLDTREEVRLIPTYNNEIISMNSSGYYMMTKSSLPPPLIFQLGNKYYSVEQFDLKYNRPDLVLKSLGCNDETKQELFHKAYLKRLKKMNFTEDMLKEDFHLPELKIRNFEYLPSTIDSSGLEIDLDIKDSKYKLDRINIYLNDVPIYGSNGIDLRKEDIQAVNKKVKIELTHGKNKIQVSVLNQAGAESFKETVYIAYEPKTILKPNLYLITIGDSKYKDNRFDLNYAAKDANDIKTAFELNSTGIYDKVFNYTFTDEKVTKENIIALKKELLKAKRDDVVIITVAGHGVLDKDLNYYLATYDMDFNNPADKGLPYEELESLVDGIAPLKKVIFLDACHSGEVDKEEVEQLAINTTSTGDVKFRAAGAGIQKKNLGLKTTSELMGELFTDLRRGTGATVISSAGGAEYAMESDQWKNGLFTYCLLHGLKDKAADANNDGQIMLSELQNYLRTEVTKLSNGAQQPTSRIENLSLDFRIW